MACPLCLKSVVSSDQSSPTCLIATACEDLISQTYLQSLFSDDLAGTDTEGVDRDFHTAIHKKEKIAEEPSCTL